MSAHSGTAVPSSLARLRPFCCVLYHGKKHCLYMYVGCGRYTNKHNTCCEYSTVQCKLGHNLCVPLYTRIPYPVVRCRPVFVATSSTKPLKCFSSGGGTTFHKKVNVKLVSAMKWSSLMTPKRSPSSATSKSPAAA